MTGRRLTGLQKDVVSLYRRCLRAAGQKPQESRENFREFARREFRKFEAISRKDINAIEFLLRKGQKQLETYAADGIKRIAP